MKKCLLFFLFTFIFECQYAQKNNEITKIIFDINKKIIDLDSLISNKKSSILVTPENFKEKFAYYQYQLGGSNLKDGRVISQSATIDPKSINFNFSIRPIKNKLFFIQPRVSLQNDDGIVSLFNKGKLQNIFTGGMNFIFLRNSFLFYSDDTKSTLVNELKILRAQYKTSQDSLKLKYQKIISITIKELQNDCVIKNYFRKKEVSDEDLTIEKLEKISKIKKNLSDLVKYGIIDSTTTSKYSSDIIDILDLAGKVLTDIAIKRDYINKSDKLQQNVVTNKSIHWISFGVDYSKNDIKLLDNSTLTKPYNYLNEFTTLKASYNYQLFKTDSYNLYIAPNISYTSNRDFRADSLLAVTTSLPYTSGSFNGQITKVENFYTFLPKRLNTWNLETPINLFYPKYNFGIEAALRAGFNNIDANNLGARFSFIIPVGEKDGQALLIQPTIKADRLFRNSTDVFWKDNFSFFINLSVNLPKLIKKA